MANKEWTIDLDEDNPELEVKIEETTKKTEQTKESEEKEITKETSSEETVEDSANDDMESTDTDTSEESSSKIKNNRANKRIQTLLQRERALREENERLRKERSREVLELKKQKKTITENQLATLKNSLETTKKALADAVAAGEAQKIVDLTETLADLKSDLKIYKAVSEDIDTEETDDNEAPEKTPNNTNTDIDEDHPALKWASKRKWFKQGTVQAARAAAFADVLIAEGLDQSDPEFYDELDERLSKDEILGVYYKNSTVKKASPTGSTKQPVASKETKSKGNNVVVLTQDDVEFAKRMNLTVEQYARELKRKRDAEARGEKWYTIET